MSPPTSSRQWRVVAYPGVDFDPFKTFNLEDSPIPDLKANQVLVKTTHFSNDPAQRTWVTDKPANRHYTQPVRVGDLMNAICMGVIAASRHSEFKEGDRVFGAWGWREYVVLDPSKLGGLGQLRKLPEGVDPSDAMALGLTV
jgi:NADPH-dependent curcumin reductase